MVAEKSTSPLPAKPVFQPPWTEDYLGRSPGLGTSTSESFADLDYELHADVIAVTLINLTGKSLRITPDGGTAGTDNFTLPSNGTIKIEGNRRQLNNYRFFVTGGGPNVISLMQQVAVQSEPLTTTTT